MESNGSSTQRGCNIPARVKRELVSLSEKHGICKVILFGSRARGEHTERSDIDIAVCGGDFDSFYWDVKEKIHSLLTFDIIALDSKISDALKVEIERDGVTIYEKT